MATRLRKLDSGLRDPSVLVPTNLFGPDVIVRCSNGLLLMGHIKSCLKGNTKELDATTTVDAINSLNSEKWFIKVVRPTR